ncbi:MAG: hypothetical protein KDJ68_08690 [Rhodobiaceae bacterium]|nr:hypothetical protein [Rhodobiaceae bacterium]
MKPTCGFFTKFALAACLAGGAVSPSQALECLRMRPTGTVEASSDWAWASIEASAIRVWQHEVADRTGVFWNQWKWENAIQREITREEKDGKRIVHATAAPCR